VKGEAGPSSVKRAVSGGLTRWITSPSSGHRCWAYLDLKHSHQSNYPAEQVAGAEIVASYGGQVVLIPVTEPVSASDLIAIKNGG
jgi:hypothetical protein